jgi:hypothetical protein
MKSLVVLFFGMLVWTQTSLARHADVSFFTKRGEPFQVVLDGRLINRYATDQLHLPAIPGGFHVAEIRLPDRFGALVYRTRIYVEPGFKVDYLIQVVGRRPKVVISKVRQYPLPVVARPLPGPYRPRHDRYDEDYRDKNRYHDRYDDDYKSRYDDRKDHRKDDRYNDYYEEDNDNRYEDREDDRYHEPADNRKREQYRQQILTAAKQKPPLVK